MCPAPRFAIGKREVSPAAAEAFSAADLDVETLFARHEWGDWGEISDELRHENERAALLPKSPHAIRSHYRLNDACEIVVVTARDRTRTKMQIAHEFRLREVSVQEGYAVWASSYDLFNPLVDVEEPVVEALLDSLPPISRAIDVGTGTGRLARKIARRGAEKVLGIDASPEMLAVAHQNATAEGLRNLRFMRAELGAAPLPVASDSFDLLTSGLMLTHVPDLRAAVRECVRVVRPGGHLILTDFHPSTSAFGWRTDIITPEGNCLLPNAPNTRQDYLDSATEAGCRLLEVQDIALDGQSYGEISPEAMQAKGLPPLCLILFAQKPF